MLYSLLACMNFINKVVDCGGLTAPENGEISITMTTRVMSTATYTCNPGFVLEGNSSRMCMSDAQWSGSDPTCSKFIVLLIAMSILRSV